MPNQFPDPSEDDRLLCVVLPDLLAFLTLILSHGRYLRVQVSILRLHLVEVLPDCPL